MRIGTWNLDARWSDAHRALLADACCDLWLLTEVNPKVRHPNTRMAGYHCHLTAGVMARGQHWAAVLSRVPLRPLPDPHEASAAALVDGVTYCATILPWAGCTNPPPTPWVGATLEDMARPAIDRITKACPRSNTVWGGDWNQNLAGGWQSIGSAARVSAVGLSDHDAYVVEVDAA